ncbi:hypothetical protein R5R35_006448 [Gryllus longicercus]|uniref:Uncharacterized protein n=1 Tax=Gryllus longicercus TaxID=2509291 RepID=A0AAN9ZFJ5_9ORTH
MRTFNVSFRMSDKYSFYSNCGCLQSESTAALKKFTKRSPQELLTNNHSYSQACLQNLSNGDSLKKMFISQESIHVVKLNTLRKRMIVTLNEIQSLLGDRPQPDGVEDLKRRQQRATEFSSRFCRNYLYPLQREMNVIARMWKNQSLNRTHSAFFSLCQKVISTHQNAHSALQAYFHHMPCSVEKGVPDKLEELLQVVNNLCSVCSKLNMSEGDSDFSSKRVKQQCQQLLIQIKTEVTDEGESCIAGSQSCTQKDVTSTPKKETMPHRFSMYSRNNLRKSNSNQNKRTVKVSVASKKRPIKLHCNKVTEKETNVPQCKQSNKRGNLTTSKIHEKIKEDGSEIGEVCASDDVRTMMEFFLAEEIPVQCSSTSKRVCSRRTTTSVLKELDKQSLPSTRTLKKLEDEIKNLKKQTKSLKEMGHPNYSVYIQALETMSNQLSEMKLRKHTSDNSNFTTNYASQEQQLGNERVDSGFPKNVKLICLTTEAEPEFLNTSQNCKETVESVASKIRKIDNFQNEDNDLQTIILSHKESKKRETQVNSDFQADEWKLQDSGKLLDVNRKKRLGFTPEFTETQSSCDTIGGIQHPNTPVTECSIDNSKITNINEVEKLTISQHEISSAIAYRRVFQDYMRSSSLYKESLRPWLMVARLANRLIDGILQEITLNDTGILNITTGLLQLEFK